MSVLPPLCFPQLAWPAAAPPAAGSPTQPPSDMDLAPVPALVDSDDDEADSLTSSPTSSLGSLREFAAAGMHPAAAKDTEPEIRVPILPAPRGSLGYIGHQRALPHPPRVATFRIDPTPPWSVSPGPGCPLVECWNWDAAGPAPVKQAPSPPTPSGPVVTITSPAQPGDSEWVPEQTRVLHDPRARSLPTWSSRAPETQRGPDAPPSRLSIAMRRAVQRRLSLSFEADSAPAPVNTATPCSPLPPPQIIVTRPDGLAGPLIGLGLSLEMEQSRVDRNPSPPRSIQGCATELPIPTVTVTPPRSAPAEAYDACTLVDVDAASAGAVPSSPFDRFEGEIFDDDDDDDDDVDVDVDNGTVDIDLACEMVSRPVHSQWGQESAMDSDSGFSVAMMDIDEAVETDDELSPSPTEVRFPSRPRTTSKRLAGRKMVQRLGLRAGLAYQVSSLPGCHRTSPGVLC